MAKIKIVGSEDLYDLEDVKGLIIQLGGKYYFKHDEENLVRVKSKGKVRIYRKESPLICRTIDGKYAKISDCVLTEAGLYLDKNSPNTIQLLDGTYTHKSWCVEINREFILKSDSRLVKRTFSGDYALKKDCIKLHEEFYGPDCYELPDPDLVKHISLPTGENAWYLIQDLVNIVEWDSVGRNRVNRRLPLTKQLRSKLVQNVFAGFKDGNNPQIGRYNFAFALKNTVTQVSGYNFYVLIEEETSLINELNRISREADEKNTKVVKKLLNSKFSDYDETENTANFISSKYQTWGGKHHLFGSNEDPLYSLCLRKTGGLGYAFGVELETSAGIVENPFRLNRSEWEINPPFIAVGDRSIGAAEYVTPVLHGSNGIEYIEKMADLIAKQTLVDDRCSVHVHIGPAGKIDPTTHINRWDLKFNHRFAIAMIKLGCDIEEELYEMLPKSRNPFNRHCHSILRYRDINELNWREYLGTFVFGPEEDWMEKLDMRRYKYGTSGYNRSAGLGNWPGGRYKWLNLVRAYSKCSSPTCEIRIWSASTNKTKIVNYILLSMAMVHVASSHYKLVMKNKFTLRDVLNLAFENHDDIISRLLDFINKRKASFARSGKVYEGFDLSRIQSIVSSPEFLVQEEELNF